MRLPFAAALLLALSGCPAPPRPVGVPAGTPLGITIQFEAPSGTARARVVSTAPGEHLETPWYPTATGPASITALGLKPATEYAHTVQISTVASAAITLHAVHATTPPLPPDVANFVMTMAGNPRGGFLLFGGSFGYEIAFDSAGTVRWYRAPEVVASATHPTQEWKIQYDGSMTAFVGSSRGWEPEAGEFVRFTPQGKLLARYSQSSDPTEPGNPVLYTDPHELLITRDADGREWLHYFAYLFRPTGPRNEPAAWHELLRTTPDGQVVFRWKAWETTSESEQTETLPGPDVDHPNSLEIAPDGDYVASFRNTDQVLKIDSRTGAVVWRLGGRRNDFQWRDDPLSGFFGQHSARVLWNGNLLVYDNGLRHEPRESRAAEYALDDRAKTATLVWEYRHLPPVFTEFVGSVQRVSDETVVAFSLYGKVCGVDSSGKVLWEANVTHSGAPAKAYRIRWVPSLYSR